MDRGIRVFLVDNHEMVRRGLRRILKLEPDKEVVGESGNAKEALLQVQHLSPDIVVMDIKMPDGNGIEVAKQLKRERFAGKVIFVTMYQEYLSQAIEAGAAGYLVKDAKAHELVSAVRRVHKGEFVVSPAVMNEVQGQELAFQYPAGQEVGASQELPLSIVENETEREASQSPVDPGVVTSDVELVISPPLEPSMLMKLHRWLKEIPGVELRETKVSRQEDTVLRVMLTKPIPLIQMLSQLPEVVSVTEEPYTVDRGSIFMALEGPEQFGIGVGHTIPKRLRLVLKRA